MNHRLDLYCVGVHRPNADHIVKRYAINKEWAIEQPKALNFSPKPQRLKSDRKPC